MLLRNYFFGKNSKMGGPTQFKISLSEKTHFGEKKTLKYHAVDAVVKQV